MAAACGTGSSPDEALRAALVSYNHARSVTYDASDAYVNDVLGFALRVGAGQGGPLSGQVGGHRWTIAFGFKQPYGAAQLSAGVPLHPAVDLVITGAANNGRRPTYPAFYPGVVAA